MRGRVRTFFQSAGVRLAGLYAGLFGLSALILIVVLWSATLGLLNGQVDAAIEADALGLAERWQDGGAQALLRTINDRLTGNVDEDAIYLVLDPAGHRIAGNLTDWPTAVSRTDAIYELAVRRGDRESLARLHRYALPSGYSLLVGRFVEPRAKLRNLLTQTLGWALMLIMVLTIAGAVLVQRLFRRMLSQVSETAAAITAGDLSPRVRLSGRGDEFDRLAETINDMLDRIGRLMDGVRQVSNAIAHDLRTPITRARARLEDAAEHATTTEGLRTEVRRAIVDLDNITAVFQALLRISEIEAGARRSAFILLDLAPLLEDLAELYGAVAEESGQVFALHVDHPLPTRGDRELIQQAIANLLDNALKFSPPGGTVRLEGRRVGAGSGAGPGAGSGTGVLHLTVGDAGPGIPDTDVPRATERFFRGETARHTPGFGLGLTLVRAVAQLHGGTLTLASNHPGLCATLTLPEVGAEDASARRAVLPEGQHENIAVGRA